MSNVKVMIEHNKDNGYYKIHIRIPDHHCTYESLKTNLLAWHCGSLALNALDMARRIIEKDIDSIPDTPPSEVTEIDTND